MPSLRSSLRALARFGAVLGAGLLLSLAVIAVRFGNLSVPVAAVAIGLPQTADTAQQPGFDRDPSVPAATSVSFPEDLAEPVVAY